MRLATGLCCCSVFVCMVFSFIIGTVLCFVCAQHYIIYAWNNEVLVFMYKICMYNSGLHFTMSVTYALWVTCLKVGGAALSIREPGQGSIGRQS